MNLTCRTCRSAGLTAARVEAGRASTLAPRPPQAPKRQHGRPLRMGGFVRSAALGALIGLFGVRGLRAQDEIAALQAAYPADKATGLAKIPGCSLVPTEWADGDSFRVRAPGGAEFTLRLYGADCIEWHVRDDTDARRLRAQRRYFGLAGGAAAESISKATKLGAAAAAETSRLLGKPFDVFTSFSDGRGDERFKRIYGFVRLADGRGLAEELVRGGLARAFGVYRKTPDGESNSDFEARLKDLELAAAKAGRGAWALTDWNRITEQRQAPGAEDSDTLIATGKLSEPDTPLDPNTASRDELMRIPGVGEATANRIIEARPYKNADELRDVSGIGKALFEKIRPFFGP